MTVAVLRVSPLSTVNAAVSGLWFHSQYGASAVPSKVSAPVIGGSGCGVTG